VKIFTKSLRPNDEIAEPRFNHRKTLYFPWKKLDNALSTVDTAVAFCGDMVVTRTRSVFGAILLFDF